MRGDIAMLDFDGAQAAAMDRSRDLPQNQTGKKGKSDTTLGQVILQWLGKGTNKRIKHLEHTKMYIASDIQ